MKKTFEIVACLCMISSLLLCSCSMEKETKKRGDAEFSCCYCGTKTIYGSKTIENVAYEEVYNYALGKYETKKVDQIEGFYKCHQCDKFFPLDFENMCPVCQIGTKFEVNTADDCYECSECGYQLVGEDIKKCEDEFVEIQEWLDYYSSMSF